MARSIDTLTDAFGNLWQMMEVDDATSTTGEKYCYLAVNGIQITMPIPKSAFKTTYNNTFWNNIRQKIANV